MSGWTLFETSAHSSAQLSDCGRYRYTLTRDWGEGRRAVFVMLNPSTADASEDDPTIRRCMGFARDWGYSGLLVLNLYAYRSTDPRELWKVDDPVGPDNDSHIRQCLTQAEVHGCVTVAAWGAHAKADRVMAVYSLHPEHAFTALGVTKNGAPRHPLYMPGSATPERWEPVT